MIKDKDADGNVVEQGVLHFGLGENLGQLVTDMAREKAWYDCQRAEGILLLVNNFGGIDVPTAEKVIDGKRKLVTNPDRETLREEKDNWTPPDFDTIRKEIAKCMKFGGYVPNERGRFVENQDPKYLAAPKSWRDMLPARERTEIVLEAQRINELLELNIWKAREAAKQFKSWLYELMIQNSQRFKDVHARPLGMGNNTSILEDLKADTKARIAFLPMDPEMKERMLRLADSQFHDADIKEDPKFENDTGWLDREGRYFGCELGLHITLGEKLAKEFYPEEIKEGMVVNGEATLEKNGWMKCTGRQWLTTGLPPNEAQIRAFKRWCSRWSDYFYNGTRYGGPGGVEE